MSGLIRWFVHNPIAANILMLAMLVGGVTGIYAVKKEVFPTQETNSISVSMSYPGAASSEVEQQIVVRIEEAIADLPGIFQITSESKQGFGVVNIRVIEGFDVKELLADVKARVDAINTFPGGVERPIIRQGIFRFTLAWVALYGDASYVEMKRWAYQIRDEMTLLDGIGEVAISGLRKDEVAIELDEFQLRKYNLTFDEVSQAIRRSSLNVPAGTIRTKDGDIQIQTRAQAYVAEDFSQIIVRSNPDGSQLRLGDVATIKDGFEEAYSYFTMNGQQGLNFEVKMSDVPLLFEGTKNTREYVENFQKLLPPGMTFKVNFEMRSLFDSRFNLLRDNALSGLILVFLILMLFMRPLLAMWVVSGIVTTFAGTVWLMPYVDVSINMLSMFAFIMVLGIVVDDAIIIGESVYRHQQQGELGKTAAINGSLTVRKPVFLAVTSTILFFLPMMDVPSEVLVYTRSLFWVVFLCLTFSLIESLFILPSHLSHMKPERPPKSVLGKKLKNVRDWFSDKMDYTARELYRPGLTYVLERRFSTYLAFTFLFVISVSLLGLGWIKSSFMPQVPNNFVMANVSFPEGTPYEQTFAVSQHIRDKVEVLRVDEKLLAKNDGRDFIREVNRSVNGSSLNVFVGLTEPEERENLGPQEVANRLRELIGPIPGAQSYSLQANMNSDGPDITLNMTLLNNLRSEQVAAVKEVSDVLGGYEGIINVRNNLDSERLEVELSLMPYAETLGITLNEIADQVRQAYYGDEVQRIPRSKEDVRVMVRYSLDLRSTLDSLDNMRIRIQGREVPLSTVAKVELVPGSSTIRRVDRRRNITITAEVEEGTDAGAVVEKILATHLEDWQRKYVGFSLSTDGALETQAVFGDKFTKNFFKAFFGVMAFFMIAFRSVFQPLLVMLAIPFGFVGAALGHWLLGFNISMMSFFGFLACSGVVVNDNLVLLERINQLRERGQDALEAVLNAGVDRFRPIVLTSITTFVGLMPILFEQSLQSQFLKPMVVALSYGVLFSSVVTLFLVPAAYVGGHNLGQKMKSLFSRSSKPEASALEATDSGANV